ncbi:hypothetical protein BDA99DRAFT_555414 [Phascolomyces articulosus]|uniref:Uncharacterized protein n=1 Tax=Phascolomyces articulosus TaxID=60185 RepID=A0AAD5KTP2_9FUNG|nr:hypothetical protein BDA99DRAFT_555414 [Phascolomyces articulosus]
MSLLDPEKVPSFNGPQLTPARRSFELSNTMGQQEKQPHRRATHHHHHHHHTTHNNSTAIATTRHGRNNSVPDRISAFYRRYRETNNQGCTNSSQTSSSYHSSLTSSSSSRSDIIEMLFARIVDALIFTSAIAITAYNYWIGALDNNNTAQPSLTSGQHHQQQQHQRQPILDIRQWRQMYAPKFNHDDTVKQHDFLEDSKRQRTQQWAETMAKQPPSPTHSSSRSAQKSKLVQFPNHEIPTKSALADPTTQLQAAPIQASNKHNKKRRTQSLPPPKRNSNAQVAQEKQDEMLNRMEEQLQSLIEEGQAALTSKVELYELDEKEVAMRKAFSQRKKYSV